MKRQTSQNVLSLFGDNQCLSTMRKHLNLVMVGNSLARSVKISFTVLLRKRQRVFSPRHSFVGEKSSLPEHSLSFSLFLWGQQITNREKQIDSVSRFEKIKNFLIADRQKEVISDHHEGRVRVDVLRIDGGKRGIIDSFLWTLGGQEVGGLKSKECNRQGSWSCWNEMKKKERRNSETSMMEVFNYGSN